MAEVVLFHHVLGVTAGFLSFADEFRRSGHVVHTPDLFDGRTFPTVDEGAAFVEEVGLGSLIERGERAVTDLTGEVVYAGISLGVLPAQKLAQTRPGVHGALFFEACVPPAAFGDGWPIGVPVQVHGMDADPFFAGEGDIDAARELVAQASRTARAELHLYPGDGHLFADTSSPAYDPEAAALLWERVVSFLAELP